MLENKSVDTALSLIQNDPSKVLGLTVGNSKITVGQYIPKADAQAAPILSFDVPSDGTYIVISLDIDAPFRSFNVLGPILHWIQPGLTPETASGDNSTKVLSAAGTPFVANYIGPAPPPGSSPHRYIFLLYAQPPAFDGAKYAPADGKKLGNWSRMRYDLGAFEKEANLGPVLACNYFCSN